MKFSKTKSVALRELRQSYTLNKTQYRNSSGEFENFTKQNGIKHYKSAPFHPATNGLVERFVQTFKNSMRAMKRDNKILSHKIANFLLNYRNTPHSVTKETPARLFMGRDLRSCLSLVRPSVKDTVMNSQMDTVFQKSRPERSRYFKVGDRIIARDYKGKGTAVIVLGPSIGLSLILSV
jgi:hypothetical protein